VTNRNDFNVIAEYDNELIQKTDLIYAPTFNTPFFESHFYAPTKNMMGQKLDTFWANVLVLWGMTLLLCITLFLDLFNKFGDWIGRLSESLRRSKVKEA